MQIVCLVIVSPVAGISPFLPFLSQVSLIHWVYCFQNNVHCSTIYNKERMGLKVSKELLFSALAHLNLILIYMAF